MRNDKKTALVSYLMGTTYEVAWALEFLGIEADVDEAEAALYERSVERCPNCGRWMELHDAVGVVNCKECQPY